MKKTLLTLNLLVALFAHSQITLRQTNFAQIGDTIYYGYDTTTVSSSLGTTNGANKIWDYSNAARNNTTMANFVSPNESPIPTPPNISHVFIDGGLNDVSFLRVNATGVETIITNPAAAFLGGEPFIGLKSISFPCTYLTRVRDTVSNKLVLPGSTLGAGELFDSIRITYTVRLDNLVDGWGTLKTPSGDYNSLRIKSSLNTSFKFEGKNNSFPIWVSVPTSSLPIPLPQNQLDVSYIWLSETGKYFLAEATMVTDTPTSQAEFRYQIPKPFASGLLDVAQNTVRLKTYPNPANEELTIDLANPEAQILLVDLYDITGKLVQHVAVEANSGNNTLTLPVSSVNNGLYTLHISGNKLNAYSRVMISR